MKKIIILIAVVTTAACANLVPCDWNHTGPPALAVAGTSFAGDFFADPEYFGMDIESPAYTQMLIVKAAYESYYTTEWAKVETWQEDLAEESMTCNAAKVKVDLIYTTAQGIEYEWLDAMFAVSALMPTEVHAAWIEHISGE